MRTNTPVRATDGTPSTTPSDRPGRPAHDPDRSTPAPLPRQGRPLRTTRRAASLAAAALALSLPLSACSSDGAGGASAADSSTGSAPSPSPTPTVDRAAYRHTLTGALGPLNSALRAVDRAGEGSALNTALNTASSRADAAADTLQMTATPDDASPGNSQLVSALRALGQDLKSAGGDGGRCATSPRVALGRAQSPQSVQAAGRALTALGYDTSLQLPRTQPAQHRRLANGALVRDGSRSGLGRLTVKNGTAHDAVVTLTRAKHTAFSLYVRHGSNATVRSVNSGSYTVYFTTGEDWNGPKSSFTRECSFEKFDDHARFKTVRVTGGTQYTVLTFTLNKVFGGNARTSTVPPAEFPS
ncbi:hypothetical protein HXP44_13150 [Streptomyces sioyaensis]|uniref:Uncharacterized protein n=1 Tax=Streptomyces sioyaensis TaxID=67364 RepID=A0A4Q1R8D3_9ACTN|nr:hypothetical protein [Streptomyces sioyaensis]MBM4792973.1 hypothetical protein [Streptomyces sioyaensis]RXS69644.1 hypothetical protein EST54_05340 [Streptomyces sioyaensis]